MNETSLRALDLLREIKSVTFASQDGDWPAARIIDVMHVDEQGLLFLTARGKSFHRQLEGNPRVAVCGMNYEYVSARLKGEAVPLHDRAAVDLIFELNPMMNDLYPGDRRDILEAFRIESGSGEIFDLSVEPPLRQRFAFGGAESSPSGNLITGECTGCGECEAACPVGVISPGETDEERYTIDRSRCLECGRCVEVCPAGAIEPAPGM